MSLKQSSRQAEKWTDVSPCRTHSADSNRITPRTTPRTRSGRLCPPRHKMPIHSRNEGSWAQNELDGVWAIVENRVHSDIEKKHSTEIGA